MSNQVVAIGSAPNDGLGDKIKAAMAKVNSNFTELYAGNWNPSSMVAGRYVTDSSSINNLTGTSYTILSSDNGKLLTFDDSSLITVTIPSGLPVGFCCTILQLSGGHVSLTAAGGVLLYNIDGYAKTAAQYSPLILVSYATNEFFITGDARL